MVWLDNLDPKQRQISDKTIPKQIVKSMDKGNSVRQVRFMARHFRHEPSNQSKFVTREHT